MQLVVKLQSAIVMNSIYLTLSVGGRLLLVPKRDGHWSKSAHSTNDASHLVHPKQRIYKYLKLKFHALDMYLQTFLFSSG